MVTILDTTLRASAEVGQADKHPPAFSSFSPLRHSPGAMPEFKYNGYESTCYSVTYTVVVVVGYI